MIRLSARTALLAAVLLAAGPGVTPLLAQVSDQQPAPTKAVAPLKVTLSADGETVYLVGMILEGSFHAVDAVLRKAPKARRIHLSSSGGFTIEARLIAALARKRRLDTYVEFYCASACTQILAAGHERVIGPHARIGFHQAVRIDASGVGGEVRPRTDRQLTSTTVFGVNGNDTLRLAYELAGVDADFIDKALSYGPENMWLPQHTELLSARVVTRLADRSEVPSPAGGKSREAVRTELLALPLWQAGLSQLPQVTEDAMDGVWRAANSGMTMAEAVQTGREQLILAATRGMARAPDALLERALALYAASARSQRARGYPGCTETQFDAAQDIGPDEQAFLRNEDALITDFLMSAVRVDPVEGREATRYFAREVVPRLTDAYRDGTAAGAGGTCRIGFRTFEAVDGLPGKKRIKAYRALLSLPGMTAPEPGDAG